MTVQAAGNTGQPGCHACRPNPIARYAIAASGIIEPQIHPLRLTLSASLTYSALLAMAPSALIAEMEATPGNVPRNPQAICRHFRHLQKTRRFHEPSAMPGWRTNWVPACAIPSVHCRGRYAGSAQNFNDRYNGCVRRCRARAAFALK
jgi:hypothetical protein